MRKPETTTGKVTLASLVGIPVAIALGMSIPSDESGRKVEASIGKQGELQVRHISGKQYLRVYLDIAGVPTACDGIIRYKGKPLPRNHTFTEEQCAEMLEEELVIHAAGVMKCSPGLALSVNPATERRREGPRFAAVSVAYNVGIGGYCGSTARRLFNAFDYTGGCTALTWWNKARVRGVLRMVGGLVNRRAREAIVCHEGLVAFRKAYS